MTKYELKPTNNFFLSVSYTTLLCDFRRLWI